MAIPPEPLADLLPAAQSVVMAHVVEVVTTDDAPAGPARAVGAADVGTQVARQVVVLEIDEVLRGPASAGQRLTVIKPVAPYALRATNRGPFLLDDGAPQPTILGRYGPDSYPEARLRAALAAG